MPAPFGESIAQVYCSVKRLYGKEQLVLTEFPDETESSFSNLNAYYDPIQHEVVVTWTLYFNNLSSGQRLREYCRLSDCLRDRSEVFNISK